MTPWLTMGSMVMASMFVAAGRADPAPVEWRLMPSLPDPIGVAAPFAGVVGDALVVAGGANFSNGLLWEGGTKVWHDAIYRLKDSSGKWDLIGHLPRPLAYGVSASHRHGILCVGGSDSHRHYADAFLLDVLEDGVRILPLPPLPQPMANGGGAVLDGRLYVVAGSGGPDDTTALRRFWVLDLDRAMEGWRELPAWPGPARIHPVVAVQDGAFFLFSGVELYPLPSGGVGRRHLRDGYRFDPVKGWTRTADLPRPVAAAPSPAAALGDSLIAIAGGDDGTIIDFKPLDQHPGFNRTLLAYHASTDTWRSLGTMPVSRVTTTMVYWRKQWIIPNGEVSPGIRSPEVWALTTTGD